MRRFISVFLCLVFLFSFFLSPIRAQALVAEAASAAAIAVLGGIAIDAFTEGTKLTVSALVSAVDSAGEVLSEEFMDLSAKATQELLDSEPFQATFEIYESAAVSGNNAKIILGEAFIDALSKAVSKVTDEPVAVPAPGTEIYVPPDSIWTQAELITSQRLLYEGFSDLAELNENVLAGNKISWQILNKVMSLSGYLRTDFVENLSLEFGSLESSITSSLTSLRTSVNLLNTTLSGKLDLINKSIQNISVSVPDVAVDLGPVSDAITDMESTLSADLVDLKSLYSTFGNSILNKIGTVDTSIGSLSDVLSADISALKTSLVSQISSLNTSVGTLQTTLSGDLATVNTSLQTLVNNLNTWDRATIDRVMENMQQIKEYQVNARDVIVQNLQQVKEYQVNARDVIVQNLQQVKEYQVLVYDRIHTEVQGVKDRLLALQNNTVYCLQTVETAVNNVGKKVDTLTTTVSEYVSVAIPDSVKVTSKPQVEVAVGAQTIVVSDYASAGQAFQAKFGFVNDIFNFLRELFDHISYQDQPPKIILNLSKTEGSYNIGEDTVMVDFTWYARFKPTVDIFLSGLIWIVFAWNVYKKLPGILSGFELSQDGGVTTYSEYGDPDQLRLSGPRALPSGRRKN